MDKEKPYIIDGVRVSKDEYNKLRSDSFLMRFKKGKKSIAANRAASLGLSLNAYINMLIDRDAESKD